MRKLVTCPEKASLAKIEYHERPSDGHILGIVRCSLCHPPDNVDCDQVCRVHLNRRYDLERARRDAKRHGGR